MRIIEDQEAKAICDGLGIDWESQPDVTDVAKKRHKGGRPWHVPGSLSPAQIWLGDAGTPGTSFEERVERRVIRSRGSDGVAYTFQKFLDWCDNDFDRTLCLWNWAEPTRDATQTKMHKQKYTHTHMHTCIHTDTQMHAHAHVHSHGYIERKHTHTHTRT